MSLLSLPTLKEKLELRFRDAPDDVSGLRMRESNLTPQDVENLESALCLKLPASFRNLIQTFDFGGGLSIGGVFFGNMDRYVDFLRTMNQESEYPWWGNGLRPSDYLLVAGTDGHVVLLEAKSGKIFAYSRDDDWKSRTCAASDFELFVRACGTVFLEEEITDTSEFAHIIAQAAGGDSDSPFWFTRIEGAG